MQAKLPRSYSVVAHHEGLSFLRPGFKSRYEHSFDVKTLDVRQCKRGTFISLHFA